MSRKPEVGTREGHIYSKHVEPRVTNKYFRIIDPQVCVKMKEMRREFNIELNIDSKDNFKEIENKLKKHKENIKKKTLD